MPSPQSWRVAHLPVTPYADALTLQRDLVAGRIDGRFCHDILLMLEHPPVYTLGRRGSREHLHVGPPFLRQRGIDVVHVERGGDITYHGPGQQVAYPVIDLKAARLGVAEYVHRLESVMIRTAADWGIRARRQEGKRGIWVGDKKLGSIGVAVRRGIAFHGLALNVCNDLEPFEWITPCGLDGVRMTSFRHEGAGAADMTAVRDHMTAHFQEQFKVALIPVAGDPAALLTNALADSGRPARRQPAVCSQTDPT